MPHLRKIHLFVFDVFSALNLWSKFVSFSVCCSFMLHCQEEFFFFKRLATFSPWCMPCRSIANEHWNTVQFNVQVFQKRVDPTWNPFVIRGNWEVSAYSSLPVLTNSNPASLSANKPKHAWFVLSYVWRHDRWTCLQK